MSVATTTEVFIERAIEKHGNKYDYSNVNYKSLNSEVKIICPIHGEFLIEPRNHLRTKSGCNKCKNNLKPSNEGFIEKAKLIHGNKYDYSKINYIGKRSKLIIICPKHGEFIQEARQHYSGCGCQKCANESVSFHRKSNYEDVLLGFYNIHHNKYDYSLVDYKTGKDKVKIICNEHGEFKQRPHDHLNGSGCPKCKESKGEKKIREWLIENNIEFTIQYKFPDCKNKQLLPFDFYLPNHNICVEYNGAQHYRPVKYWGGEETLKNIKFRDNIKKEYCENNNITLLIIRYNENIIDKLNKLV